MLETIGDLTSCPLMYTFSTISGKWKPFIIWYLSISPNHSSRYGALKNALPYKISHKMMAQHLKELEQDGIVHREEYDEAVMRVEYSLTEKGLSLANIIYLLRDWGAVYGDFSREAVLRTRGHIDDEGVTYYQDESNRATPDHLKWVFDYKSQIESRDASPS